MPLAVPAFPNVAARAAGAAARAAEILRDPSYQTSLPPPAEQATMNLPLGPLEIVLKVLLVAGIAVLVVLVATWLARRLGLAARDAEAEEPAPGTGPEPTHLPVEGAEALAGSKSPRPSASAKLPIQSPAASFGRYFCFCASLPAWSSASVAR